MSGFQWKQWYPLAVICLVITAGIAVVFAEFAYTDARYGQHPVTTVTTTVNTTVIDDN